MIADLKAPMTHLADAERSLRQMGSELHPSAQASLRHAFSDMREAIGEIELQLQRLSAATSLTFSILAQETELESCAPTVPVKNEYIARNHFPELTLPWGDRVVHMLAREGITTYEQLQSICELELLHLPNMGKKVVDALKQAMRCRGRDLAPTYRRDQFKLPSHQRFQ